MAKNIYCIGGDYKDSRSAYDNFAWTKIGSENGQHLLLHNHMVIEVALLI
jgi:hypothetical protein